MTSLRRAASVALALSAAAMLATSSLGFTSATAERGVGVNVVAPEDAYVGVAVCEKNQGGGNANPVRVWVTNQYSRSLTVADVTSDTGDSLAPGQRNERLGVGERARFESLRANDEVTVHVAGGLDAAVTVQVQQKGDCPSTSGHDVNRDSAESTTTPRQSTTANAATTSLSENATTTRAAG